MPPGQGCENIPNVLTVMTASTVQQTHARMQMAVSTHQMMTSVKMASIVQLTHARFGCQHAGVDNALMMDSTAQLTVVMSLDVSQLPMIPSAMMESLVQTTSVTKSLM